VGLRQHPSDLLADGVGERYSRRFQQLRERAGKAGVGYVDTYAPSVGRDACADPRWVEPLVPRAPAASVHPNERGEQGMADAVLKTLGG
jgi:hypothetical protein